MVASRIVDTDTRVWLSVLALSSRFDGRTDSSSYGSMDDSFSTRSVESF